MKYIILIPSYEADNKLLNLLKEINKKYDTIVIDDGSKDKSIYDEVKKYAHLISYEINMGKGFALKTGFKYIKENYKDYVVVCMDSDGQHDLSDAIKLCDYVSEHKDVLALGSRNWDKTTPLRSRFGNGITRWVFKRKTGINIHDTQTGLRAFSNELMDYMLSIKGNRYEYEMNVLLNLKSKNIAHRELDIKTIYIDNNKGSHFKPIKDSFKIYKDIFKWKKNNKK